MKAKAVEVLNQLKIALTKPVFFVKSDKGEYDNFSKFLEITYIIIVSVFFIFRLFQYNPATKFAGYIFMLLLSVLLAKLSIWSGTGIYTYFLNLGCTQKVSYLYVKRTLIPYLLFYTLADTVLLVSPTPLLVTKLVLYILAVYFHYIIFLICNLVLVKKRLHTVLLILASLASWCWSILRLQAF